MFFSYLLVKMVIPASYTEELCGRREMTFLPWLGATEYKEQER